MTTAEQTPRHRTAQPTADRQAMPPGPTAGATRQPHTPTPHTGRQQQPLVYISGPMSGLSREEYLQNFRQAEARLRRQGYRRILNPARFLVCRWPWLYRLVGYELTLTYDLWRLMRCTHIFMLKGWQQSRGARIEHAVAEVMGMEIIYEEKS